MKTTTAIILGAFILISTICHALLVKPAAKPSASGYIRGEVWKLEQNGTARLKCNGFKAELYDSFVLIHVDKAKEPSWTENCVFTIPWTKVEQLTLLPEGAN